MALDATKLDNLVNLGHLQSVSQKIEGELAALRNIGGNAIKKVDVEGNTIRFYRDLTEGAAAAFTVDFPSEIFLDQATTQFVPSFTFNAATYTGATDPNLNGKPVMVLGVKTTTGGIQTISYSFLDMATLVDTYSPADGETAVTINGYRVSINVSAQANNALEKKADGLFVNISGKADKVVNATNGNVAGLDASGNLTDGGIAVANILTTANVATTQDVTDLINDVWPSA
jgi:hypothetical protein